MNLLSTIGLGRIAAWGMGLVIVLGVGACDSGSSSDASACDPGVAVCQCTKKSDCAETENCLNNQCVPGAGVTQGNTVTSSTGSETASTSTSTGTGGAGNTSGTGGAAGANGDTSSTGGSDAGPPSVVLVLDRSTSAAVEFEDGKSRWEAIVEALTEAGGPVEQNAASVALGVIDYTGFQDDVCPAFGAGVDAASDNYAAVSEYVAALQLPDVEKSEAPTREAIEQGSSMLSGAGGRKALIVITDSITDDTCGSFDNQGCVSQAYYAAQQAYTAGVRTYILGITDIDDAFLQGVANAGTGAPVANPQLGQSCGPENEQPTYGEPGGNAPFWEAVNTEEISSDLASIFDAIRAN